MENNTTITKLKEIAKELGIKGISKMKKEELIDAIESISKPKKEEIKEDLKETEVKPQNNEVHGVIEVLEDGFGFLRSENFLTGSDDCYVSPTFVRKFNLKTGDMIHGNTRPPRDGERFNALIFIKSINGDPIATALKRKEFDSLTPIFPNERKNFLFNAYY